MSIVKMKNLFAAGIFCFVSFGSTVSLADAKNEMEQKDLINFLADLESTYGGNGFQIIGMVTAVGGMAISGGVPLGAIPGLIIVGVATLEDKNYDRQVIYELAQLQKAASRNSDSLLLQSDYVLKGLNVGTPQIDQLARTLKVERLAAARLAIAITGLAGQRMKVANNYPNIGWLKNIVTTAQNEVYNVLGRSDYNRIRTEYLQINSEINRALDAIAITRIIAAINLPLVY